MAAGLPGVKVGPLDPDSGEEFGSVGRNNTARRLIRNHAQAHPPQLRQALARPLDPERTKALVFEEVRGYVAGLQHENGDAVIPDGAVVVGAQVRGDRDSEQVLTFTYRVKSGRTAKWFAPYDSDELPDSVEAGDELVRVKNLRERGLVAWDAEGTSAEVLRRQASGLRRERDALRERLSKAAAEDVEETDTDVRPDVQVVADNEDLRRENEELRERVAALQQLADRAGEASLRPEGADEDEDEDGDEDDLEPGTAAEEPPFEGYDDVNAKDLVTRIRDENTPREDVEAILAFERRHNDRKSVVSAAEVRLGNE